MGARNSGFRAVREAWLAAAGEDCIIRLISILHCRGRFHENAFPSTVTS